MKRHFALLIITLATLSPLLVNAQLTAPNAFRTAPKSVIDHFSETMKLDLIDYAKASMTNKVKNQRGSESFILKMTDDYLDLSISPSADIQFAILPIRGKKIIAVISTVFTPAPDSKIRFYAGNWAPIDLDLFRQPTLDDWLTSDGKKYSDRVTELVPFLMTGYHYEEKGMELSISLNLNQYLTVEAYDEVKTLLHPQLTYIWDGKKFTKKK